MNYKKIALIALVVVMLLSSIIAFGCKPKTEEAAVDSTLTAQPPADSATAVMGDSTGFPPAGKAYGTGGEVNAGLSSKPASEKKGK